MDAIIQSCADTLQLTDGQAARLLSLSNWNLEKTVLSWLARTSDTCCGISIAAKASQEAAKECPLCYEDLTDTSGYHLSCGHTFCRTCWASYLKTKLEENLALSTTCPSTDCDRAVLLEDAGDLDHDGSILDKFKQALFRSFVDNSDSLFWCKNPKGCKCIVAVPPDQTVVTCDDCHFAFCTACVYPAHLPATCTMMKDWDKAGGYQDLSEEEGQVRKLKLEITRPCPKCSAPIEKNGGCPHMTCGSW